MNESAEPGQLPPSASTPPPERKSVAATSGNVVMSACLGIVGAVVAVVCALLALVFAVAAVDSDGFDMSMSIGARVVVGFVAVLFAAVSAAIVVAFVRGIRSAE